MRADHVCAESGGSGQMKQQNITEFGIVALQAAIEQGELTSAEVFGAYHERIIHNNPKLNAYTAVAQTFTPWTAHGILEGVPLAVKDIFDVAGYATTAGSKFLHEMPDKDADVVEDMLTAGCTLMGKTNTHEFAMGGTTINPHFGATANPWDPDRIAGGSSGGSAAAVAARMALIGLGSDTAGSIRIPAALCGIVGLKPTFGRLSCAGVVPLSWSLDHIGLLARDAKDMAAAYRLWERQGERIASYGSARIGVIYDAIKSTVDKAVEQAMEEAMAMTADMGHRLVPCELPWWEEGLAAGFVISRVEGASYHEDWLQEFPEQYGDDVRILLEAGKRFSGVEYVKSLRLRTMILRAYQELFSQFDYLMLPTVSILAPMISEPSTRSTLTQLTAPFNMAGVPAISLPLIPEASRLPAGIQFVAPWGQEHALLAFAQQWEEVRGPMPVPEMSYQPK